SLLETGNHSDFVITCQDETFNVHKAIVCPQSDFFEKALTFAAGKEAEDCNVNLPSEDSAIVRLLVQYFYKADYDPVCPPTGDLIPGSISPVQSVQHSCTGTGCYSYSCCKSYVCPHHCCGIDCSYDCVEFICSRCGQAPKGNAEQLLTHVKLYEVADKYGVTGLKDLSADKFRRALLKFWNNAEFPIAAHYACSTTPDSDMGLRSHIEKTILAHPKLLSKPEIEDMLKKFPNLAFRMLKEEKKV
ncbi:hypothetical protein P171DRAFT_368958, partial [Karstenula rhodostoma CBS 690.94]